MIGSWDDDFVFSEGTKLGESDSTTIRQSQASDKIEDWDLEMLMDGRGNQQEAETGFAAECAVKADAGAHNLAASYEEETCNRSIKVFAYDEEKPDHRLESLLEYIDGHHASNSAVHLIPLWPRPPVLYSAYRRPSFHGSGVTTSIHAKRSDTYLCHDTDAYRSREPSTALEQRPCVTLWHHRLDLGESLSPHAPESPQGVVTWLVNLSEKIRSTKPVVARPSPKLIGGCEYERHPSEELALERQLRLIETAFCSAALDDDLVNATRMLKSLLRRLDLVGSTVVEYCSVRALLELGFNSGMLAEDIEARSVQCVARLVRLTCRLARRCGKKTPAFGATKIDSADIASLRRCSQAMVCDKRHSSEDKLRIWLLLCEGMSHLALLHGREHCRSHCTAKRIGCWCLSLPPLPRAAFAHVIAAAQRYCCLSSSLIELEAMALADMLLDTMGYSPLTCEQLLGDGETLCGVSFDDIGLTTSKQKDLDGGIFRLMSAKEVGAILTNSVRSLPATCLARGKAAFALGILHLWGAEGSSAMVYPTPQNHDTPAQARKAFTKPVPTPSCPKYKRSRFTHHASQTELKVAEMLLFEATCVIEQHATFEPLDLPVYACHYGADLVTEAHTAKQKHATCYSALACSIGYSALRAFARSLDRRLKHAYSALALEVCIDILELHTNQVERRRLQRELAIVSVRQGNCSCRRNCLRVLADVEEKFKANKLSLNQFSVLVANVRQVQVDVQTESSGCVADVAAPPPRHVEDTGQLDSEARVRMAESILGVRVTRRRRRVHWLRKWQQRSCSAQMHVIWSTSNLRCALKVEREILTLENVHEVTLATELAITRNNIPVCGESEGSSLVLELIRKLRSIVTALEPSSAAAVEIEAMLDRTSLGQTRLALSNANSRSALCVLNDCIRSGRISSIMRRIAMLSWIAKVVLGHGQARDCGIMLARIRRLRHLGNLRRFRQHSWLMLPPSRRNLMWVAAAVGVSPNRPKEMSLPSVVHRSLCGITSRADSCLLSYCGPKHETGELAARSHLACSNPLSALKCLAPTVEAMEGVISRLGLNEGLEELGRMYHLRGVIQEAVSRGAHYTEEFPLRLHNLSFSKHANRQIAFEGCCPADTPSKLVRESHPLIRNSTFINTQYNLHTTLSAHSIEIATLCGTSKYLLSQLDQISPIGASWYAELTAVAPSLRSSKQVKRYLGRRRGGKNHSEASIRRSKNTISRNPESVDIRRAASREQSDTQATRTDGPRRTQKRRHHWSRHYGAYFDSDDIALDALRWYRDALLCFKARHDDIGVCCSASAFARLQLERVISPVAFDRVTLPAAAESLLCLRGRSQRAHSRSWKNIVDDVFAAARCALSLAALACDPILLLETYLNVAEVHLIRRNRLAAIAHWWEARDIFLRLFVAGSSIPILGLCRGMRYLIDAIRHFLERLLRFLAACDRAMINENLLLFDVFINFERDARTLLNREWVYVQRNNSHTGLLSSACVQELVKQQIGESQNFEESPPHCLSLSWRQHQHLCQNGKIEPRGSPPGASRSLAVAWACMVRIRNDVAMHRLKSPFSFLSDLRDRNRAALCLLNSNMHFLRIKVESGLPRTLSSGVSNTLHNLIYAIHIASTMVVYCPMTGARHVVACGCDARRLDSLGSRVSIGHARAKSLMWRENTATCRDPESLRRQHTGLSPEAAVFIAALAMNLNRPNATRNERNFSKVCYACGAYLSGALSHSTTYRPSVCSESRFRKRAISAIKRDLALAPRFFDGLVLGSNNIASVRNYAQVDVELPTSVRLVCSERAQLVPWECMSEGNVCVSRTPCASGPSLLLNEIVVESGTSILSVREETNMKSAESNRVLRVTAQQSVPTGPCISLARQNESCLTSLGDACNHCKSTGYWENEAEAHSYLRLVFELCSRQTLALVSLTAGKHGSVQHNRGSAVKISKRINKGDIRDARICMHPCCLLMRLSRRISGLTTAETTPRCVSTRRGDASSDWRVRFLEYRDLQSPWSFLEASVNVDSRTLVLFVPGLCLDVVRAEADHLLVSTGLTDQNSSLTRGKNARGLLLAFAHHMTRKHSVPIVVAWGIQSQQPDS